MKGRPRFFCENCGTEVPRNAKNCPSCGRRFASVRCPKCGFTGDETQFADGCPVCGYSAKPGEIMETPWAEKPEPAGALPFWVYLVTILALLIAAGIFFHAVFR